MDTVQEKLRLRTEYIVECFGPDGKLKWTEKCHNLVDTEGLNDVLNKYFKGSGYTATWYVGLIDNAGYTTGPQAGDTAAKINLTANPPTTNAWQEADNYTEAARQALTLGSVSGGSVSNSASKAAFSMNGTVTIKGAFLASVVTVGGTTGVLYGSAAFAAARDCLSGDTLNVTATLTAASA